MCVKGQWTVQRQEQHSFASIACDQAIEQTVNCDTKTTGGLRGISLNQGQFLHMLFMITIGSVGIKQVIIV